MAENGTGREVLFKLDRADQDAILLFAFFFSKHVNFDHPKGQLGTILDMQVSTAAPPTGA